MMALFSAGGQRRLDQIVKPGILCVFDFDGTLAPIVPQPEQARMTLAVRKRMLELSRLAPVAIVSGRGLDDVAERLGFQPRFVVGNHGLEGIPGREHLSASYETMCRDWEQAIRSALEDRDRFDPGIRMENKKYSLSVHYRFARDQLEAEQRLTELFAGLSPSPRIISGKCVFNLLPPDAAGKGDALEQLIAISGAPTALYVGDDVTDEDAFAVQHSGLMTVRVGWNSNSAAQYFLSQRGEIALLLDDLIRRLRWQDAYKSAS